MNKDEIRAAIVAEARTWIGTPFKHHAAVKGRGTDCIGLVVGVAAACGLAIPDPAIYRGYHTRPDGRVMVGYLRDHGVQIPREEALPGDVLLFRHRAEPQHLAILSNVGVIVHSDAVARRVVEHELSANWKSLWLSSWRFRELA